MDQTFAIARAIVAETPPVDPDRPRNKNVAVLSCRSQAPVGPIWCNAPEVPAGQHGDLISASRSGRTRPSGICAMLRGGFCYNFVIEYPPTNFSSKKHQNYNDLQSNMTQSLNSDGNTSSYKDTKQ